MEVRIFQSTPPVKAATIEKPLDGAEILFQSTPPVKAATHTHAVTGLCPRISIHAAREGGDARGLDYIFNLFISIHAAREGGDAWAEVFLPDVPKFQSTPPVKAATAWTNLVTGIANISIHAAREGGDGAKMVVYGVKAYFNPRRP